MNKGVFLCVGTGGHVLPAYNVIKSMLDQGIDKKNTNNENYRLSRKNTNKIKAEYLQENFGL